MSDEERDVDIESDAEKRAHHNALERKRRDHIKESFHSLRDSVPTLQGEKTQQLKSGNSVVTTSKGGPPKNPVCQQFTQQGGKTSRAQILKQATDYITFMTKKNNAHQQDIEDLKRQNTLLEQQVRALEKAKAAGTFATQSSAALEGLNSKTVNMFDHGSDSDSDMEASGQNQRKKLKT